MDILTSYLIKGTKTMNVFLKPVCIIAIMLVIMFFISLTRKKEGSLFFKPVEKDSDGKRTNIKFIIFGVLIWPFGFFTFDFLDKFLEQGWLSNVNVYLVALIAGLVAGIFWVVVFRVLAKFVKFDSPQNEDKK